jgi:tRNA uridine 5-carboxymethylaminomethyl modification enzyme
MVKDDRWDRFEGRRRRYQRNLETLNRTSVKIDDGARVPASHALRQQEVRLEDLVTRGHLLLDLDPLDRAADMLSAETAVKYDGYLRRQSQAVERSRKQENIRIPPEFPFDRVPGLSRELVQRFSHALPETLGQALRIPGATPAAVAVVSAYLRQWTPPGLPTHAEAVV